MDWAGKVKMDHQSVVAIIWQQARTAMGDKLEQFLGPILAENRVSKAKHLEHLS